MINERKRLKYEEEKERRERLDEERRKMKQRQVDIDLKKALETQLQERKLIQQQEQRVDQDYMREWVRLSTQALKKQEVEEEQRRKKLRDNQSFLIEQIEGMKVWKRQVALSKSPLRGTMNAEELKLNKQILQEISVLKKNQQLNNKSSSATNNNIINGNKMIVTGNSFF